MPNSKNKSIFLVSCLLLVWQYSIFPSASESLSPHVVEKVKIKAFMKIAERKMKRKEYKAAADSFTSVLNMDVKNVKALVGRGLARYEMNDYPGSLDDLAQALKIADKPNQDRALPYYYGRVLYYAKRYNESIEQFNEAIRLNPDNAEAYVFRASAWDALGQPEKAIVDLTDAIKLNDNKPDFYVMRALQYKQLKKYDLCLADLDTAIKLDPKLVHWRASINNEIGSANNASDDYSSSIKLEKGFSKASQYANRGRVYLDIGRCNQAVCDFTQAMKLNPSSSELLTDRARAYFRMGNYTKAIGDLTKGITCTVKHNLPENYFRRAKAYFQLRKMDKAMSDLNAAINMSDKKDKKLYVCRGLVYSDQGETQKAIDDFSQAITIDPNDALPYLNRAKQYLKITDYPKAIADYSQALTIDPNMATAFKARGEAKAKSGDKAGAISDWQAAQHIYEQESDRYGMLQVARLLKEAN